MATLLGTTLTSAQSSGPVIQSFTTSATTVTLAELEAGTARIPVSWAVINRPVTTNLQFDQYLPTSGTYHNVELPRPWYWVSSSGAGMTAPIVPDGGDGLRLRLRVIDWRNGQVLTERELIVPINVNNPKPIITEFRSSATSVNLVALENRTARVPVTWAVTNRPGNTNLKFDQVMADGSLSNVELPRPDPYVASAGNGMAAPYAPGGNNDTLRLRLRLVNLSTDVTLFSRDIVLTINANGTSAEPSITFFNVAANTVLATQLEARTVYLGVAWGVENRPANSNLIFEQIMPDGSLRNVELPRPNPFVSSAGNGTVRPYLPASRPDSIQLQLRLVNLDNNTTLKSRQIDVQVAYDPGSVEIVSFDVQPRQATSGDTVTVSWDVRGTDTVAVRIIHQDTPLNGNLLAMNNREVLQANGSTQVIVPDDVVSLSFWLDADGTSTGPIDVAVIIDCEYDWFADLDQAECADGPVQSVQAAYQQFERGFMLWHDDTIWVIYNTGNGAVFADAWDGSDITYDQQPPAGQYLPERGFGALWVQNDSVREGLGWATALEQGYTMQQQQYIAGVTTVITFDLPDGTALEGQLQGNSITEVRD